MCGQLRADRARAASGNAAESISSGCAPCRRGEITFLECLKTRGCIAQVRRRHLGKKDRRKNLTPRHQEKEKILFLNENIVSGVLSARGWHAHFPTPGRMPLGGFFVFFFSCFPEQKRSPRHQ